MSLLLCLSLFAFRVSFGLVIPDSSDCSLQSVTSGVFPGGCFVDIEDVVTDHLCGADSDLEDSQSLMTAINVGESNSTYLYVLNWQGDGPGRGLVFSTESGIWMSSAIPAGIRSPGIGYPGWFFPFCSTLVFYANDDEPSVLILPTDFPFGLSRDSFINGLMNHFVDDTIYYYVKVSKPNFSSFCNETVIAIGKNIRRDIKMWELKYKIDDRQNVDVIFEDFDASAYSSKVHHLQMDEGIAVSNKDIIIYIVCNNETFGELLLNFCSSEKREVWHFSLSNRTWSWVGKISVPYKEKKLFGHVIDEYGILVICSPTSCTKYNYDLNGWYLNEIFPFSFSFRNALTQPAYSFSAIGNSIIILSKCLLHNLTFTATETIVNEIQSKEKEHLSFENARNIASTSFEGSQYFLFFLNLQTAIVLRWYFERRTIYYNEKDKYEVQYQMYSYRNLPYLYGYTLSILEGYLVVFGGVKGIYDPDVLPESEEDLNAEIWYLVYNLNIDSNQGWWNSTPSFLPPLRFFHSAISVYDDQNSDSTTSIIVYGGLGFIKKKLKVFNDLWRFERDDEEYWRFPDNWKWTRIIPAEHPFPPMFRHVACPNFCFAGFLAFGCERFSPEDYCNETNAFALPTSNYSSSWNKVSITNTRDRFDENQVIRAYSPIIGGTSFYSDGTVYDLFSMDIRSYNIDDHFFGYWIPFVIGNGILLALDRCDVNLEPEMCAIFLVQDVTRARASKLFVTKVNCPDGSERMSRDGEVYGFGCKNCSVGSYSFDGSSCLKCPFGVTTNKNSSASISDCKICSEIGQQHCKNGVCNVNVTANSTMICKCQDGYNRDNDGSCSVKSTIEVATLSSSGAILLVVVTGISIILHKLYQIKKRNEANLKSFENIWNIGFQEIKFDRRLDTEISGAYGEVYRGTYRQIAVAIKRLQYYQMQIIKRSRVEFAREIEVMKTIRHPNVVMFFGGGKFRDGTPFLVMELMHRGSMTAVLHNKDIALEKEAKFSFALDGARGMNYLHMMKPP